MYLCAQKKCPQETFWLGVIVAHIWNWCKRKNSKAFCCPMFDIWAYVKTSNIYRIAYDTMSTMKPKTKFLLYLLLNTPGIAVHELSHVVFCWLVKVKVVRVVFFQLKNPPGFVEHHQPSSVLQSFFISFGPFLFGSMVSCTMFLLTIYTTRAMFAPYLLLNTQYIILAFLAFYLAVSTGLNLFPSNEDATVLLENINRHVLHRFNIFAILLYPFVLLIHLFNFLKRVHIDWLYTIVLFVLAWWIVNIM